MKRLTTLFLGLFMVLTLFSCSGESDVSEQSSGEIESQVEASSEEADSKEQTESEAEMSEDKESSAEAVSSEMPSEEPSSEGEKSEASEEPSSEESSSEEIPSEEPSSEAPTSDFGKEQFNKVAAIDSVLKDRGFKKQGANSDYVPLNYDKMKAMWISQFDFGSVYCSGSQRSENEFRNYVGNAFDKLTSLGFNTVIVQVRPNADSFYPSAYYPWSHYVLGSYGRMGKYDPLEIMIEEAHSRKISFQAWINPMRGMSPANLSKINSAYPMTQWKKDPNKSDYLYTYNSLCYLNIAYEEVRQLIIDGAAEIVRNYDVDGVHMDDYFYFGEEPNFDIKAFTAAKSQSAILTLRKFRFNNLNTLVSGIYSAIKAENKNVIFGISPAGNLDSMATKYYADVNTWLSKDGYVDYIMPQIYFGMEHQTWSFPYTYQRWNNVVRNPNVKFMFGITFLKVGTVDQYAGSGMNEWLENDDVIKRCFEYAEERGDYSGYAVFSYTDLFNPITGDRVSLTVKELENCKSYLKKIKGEIIRYN